MMAKILQKLNVDMGAAGGLLSEIADFKLKADQQELDEMQADRLYEQTQAQTREAEAQTELKQEEVDLARDALQVDLDKSMIEQYGAPVAKITEQGVAFKEDIFKDEINPVTGKKVYAVQKM